MKENKKILYVLVVIALVLSIVGISIGFAAMSTELTINGTATVVPASWKIKFQNLSKVTGEDANIISAPQITSDTHIGNYSVKLSKPGDKVVYKFEVANTGSLDAELTSYTFATPTITGTSTNAAADAQIVSDNLVYTLTYNDASHTPIQVGDDLDKEDAKELLLTVAYNEAATELPENEVSITGMDVTFVYGQK